MYKAVIEMPKGDNRRRHLSHRKNSIIDLGAIKDIIPVNDGIMPIHYGYIKDTKNAVEGDEVDVLVFSSQALKSGDEIEIFPIALLRRDDGDDKIVAVSSSTSEIKTWNDIPKEERELILSFFSYHHKINAIENSESADLYIKASQI